MAGKSITQLLKEGVCNLTDPLLGCSVTGLSGGCLQSLLLGFMVSGYSLSWKIGKPEILHS